MILHNVLIIAAMMGALWVVSLVKKDVSIVDPWWSMGFLLILGNSVREAGLTPGRGLLLALVALWSLRLWAYLLWRARGTPEDARYTAFRTRYGPRYPLIALGQVFGLQGALQLLISAPLVAAALAPAPDPLRWNDLLGAALALFGTAYEAIADAQMAAFKRNRHGPVMDRGLWARSRHPNYFGEAVLWWGFWLMSIDAPWGLATVFAPALMSYLLLRVSGVTMLEAQLKARGPEYARYVEQTPEFFPRLW